MSESSEHTTQVRGSIEDQVGGAEAQQEEALQPRRTQRDRTLTEKGREMQDEKIKLLQQRFNYIYDKWRTQIKSSKKTLSQSTEPLPNDLLNDIICCVTDLSADVQHVYDELREVSTPEQDTRRKVDLCVGISKLIVSKAISQLDGKIPEEERQDWPEAGSLFDTTTCRSGSFTSLLKSNSECSSRSSVKRQEAAAEAAASQAVLKVLQEQEKEQLEIQRLEAEAKRKIADQEAAAVRRHFEREAEEVK